MFQKRRSQCESSAGPLSYCERVTSAEYEQQRHEVAHDALLQLLDDIVDNDVMSPATKRRRLLQVSVAFLYHHRYYNIIRNWPKTCWNESNVFSPDSCKC